MRVKAPRQRSAIYQVVCSPIRNPLSRIMRYANILAVFTLAGVIGRLLTRLAGLPAHALTWRLEHGPMFENAIATLDLDGREATLRWEAADLVELSEVRLAC